MKLLGFIFVKLRKEIKFIRVKRFIFILVCLSCCTLYGATLSIHDQGFGNDTTNVAGNNKAIGLEIAKPEIKWNIYPNPVVDILHISGVEGFYNIKLMNAVGQVVVSIKGTSAEIELNLSDQPAGMYLLKIETQGKSVTRKLIKK